MSLRVLKFRSLQEANLLINGALAGRELHQIPAVFRGLVGKTVTFTAPSGSVTFTQPTDTEDDVLRFKDVKEQMEAQITDLVVTHAERSLIFQHATAGTAVTLGAANEPGRRSLGLSVEAAAGMVYGPTQAASAPRVVEFTMDSGFPVFLVEDEDAGGG